MARVTRVEFLPKCRYRQRCCETLRGVSEVARLLGGGSFFEAPRWRDGRWWVADFYRERVVTVEPSGREAEVMRVAGQPSGLGWMPDGSLLVVSRCDGTVLRRWPTGDVMVHADVAHLCGGYLNDMVVDRHGRAYVGEMGFALDDFADPTTAMLIRIDPDGTASVVAEDLYFPNGAVITPDGGTLIVGETIGARYTAFMVERDGSLSNRRVWAQVAPTPELTTLAGTLAKLEFAPDGCSLDADRLIWSADEVGARCVRLAPGGRIVAEIAIPDGLTVFACMLGGDDGRTLMMCAAPDFDPQARKADHESVLLTTTVEVPHAGLP
jgi:sugar lactone lactonase YvrE